MHQYQAKMDNLAKMMSMAVSVVLVLPIVTMMQQVQQGHWEVLLIIGIVAAILIACMCYRPLGYTLEQGRLAIRRVAGNLVIDLSEITEIKPVTKTDLGGGMRTFGVGGFFGYFGKFRYRNIGNVTMYATDMNKLVLLRTADKVYLISPDEQEDFLRRIQSMMK